jgi:integrase/recombinase XerC
VCCPAAYLASLRDQRQLSPHTISSYARDLQQLTELVQMTIATANAQPGTDLPPDLPPYTSVSHAHVRKFAAQLHARGLDPANPVDGVKAPKRARPLPKALAADDAIALVSHPNPLKDSTSAMQLCNRAMFELLYSSGLRVAELSGLDVRYVAQDGYASSGWIDFDSGEVTVTGKGNKMRNVPVGGPALQAIRAWLAVRAPAGGADAALFLTERGTRMSPRVLQLRIKAHAQALGIPSNVHPHVLRHSFASHMLQGSGDLRAVQEMLGHASITATQVYTSLDFQRLAQVYDAAHPRAKKIDKKVEK